MSAVSATRSGSSSCATRSLLTSATMISPDLVVDGAEEAARLHPLGLPVVVLGGREVVHRVDPVAVDEEELQERHQPLAAQAHVERVLVADREDAAPAPVLDRVEDDVGGLLARRR